MVKTGVRGSVAAGAFAILAGLAGCAGGGSTSSTPSKPASPPVAVIGGGTSGAPNTPIPFGAGNSTDPQGQTLSFAWDFGDGGTATGTIVSHTYTKSGLYTVTLTATDTSGLSSKATDQVPIALPPTANAGGPYSGSVGLALTFNGAGSSDPQGLPLTYSWKFGDGTTGTGVAPTHIYSGTGTYTVSLSVANQYNFESPTVTTKASIGIPPPTVTTNGPWTGKPTLPIAFTSTASDPYDSTFTYLWSFGDGATANTASPTHTYASVGAYNVSLVVTGQYAESTTVTSTATITAQSAGTGLSGVVQSGTTPVVGAHVYLLAANTTGYGQPSVSLLTGTGASDTIGAYVVTGADGSFTLPSGYSCPVHSQVYLYAADGTVSGKSNDGATWMTALGACGGVTPGETVTVNEVTTVAAAYGLSGYATDPLHVSSPNTSAAQTGIANGFLNAANLASAATGQALSKTASGTGTAPQSRVNTLADVLYACANGAAGSKACTMLFADAASSGAAGTPATDTADAALNIAHFQGANTSLLFGLLAAEPFTPALTSAPNDFTMPVTYSGLQGYGTQGLAIDGAGNVWVMQWATSNGGGKSMYLNGYTSDGHSLVSETVSTCSSDDASLPNAIAIDPSNNVWLLATGSNNYSYTDPILGPEILEYSFAQYCTVSNTGALLSPQGGYVLGGNEDSSLSLFSFAIDGSGNGLFPATTLLKRSLTGAALNGAGYALGNTQTLGAAAVDGSGNTWVTLPAANSIAKISSSGAGLPGASGGGLSYPASVVIDHSGNVWAINSAANYLNSGVSLSKFTNAGAALSPSTGFADVRMPAPYSVAIDGAGNVWVATAYSQLQTSGIAVVELNSSGTFVMDIDHANQNREYLNGPQSLAIDSTGSLWVSNGLEYDVTQFVGVAVPVVTPLAANLAAPYTGPASLP